MNEVDYLLAGGIPGLLFLLAISTVFLTGAAFSMYAIFSQRKYLSQYSADEVPIELRAIQCRRASQWQITLFGTIMGDIFLVLFTLIIRGPIFGLIFVFIFFNLLLTLRTLRQYEKVHFLRQRLRELQRNI